MVTQALRIQNLSHQYFGAEKPLLTHLHLAVEQGASFGLFGPNGAGKTTLMSLITGVISYQNGDILIFDKELKKHKNEVLAHFGYVPQSLSLYEELSPKQNLRYFGAMLGLTDKVAKKRTAELLAVLGLENVATKPVKQFSGGMKRRVNLAIGVIHQPKILFLDEPTVGVDVQTRHAIINYLKELNKQGTTLFYTSHHLAEAQELCTQIALIDNGQIMAQGELANLLTNHNQPNLEALFLALTGKEYRD